MVNGKQIVNDFKAVTSSRVIDAGNIGDLSELGSCVILEKSEHRNDGRWRDIDCQLVFPDRELLNVLGKTGNKVSPVSI